ncbi:unnamed protein product [Clonostachys byssicola]|uniref:Protein kinase domain-containing protein n=1 Tax=Clonostachys byssicola TaxID=160290 RepID=A0A9N9UHE2_9HYPO|nr:unnamed protein product [Clonostachys byssicola]
MALMANEQAMEGLKLQARKCKDYVQNILFGSRQRYANELTSDNGINAARTRARAYAEPVDVQLSYINDSHLILTAVHCSRLNSCMNDLEGELSVFSHSIQDRNFYESFCEVLGSWIFQFDRYWGLYALYEASVMPDLAKVAKLIRDLIDPSKVIDPYQDENIETLREDEAAARAVCIPNTTVRYIDQQDTEIRWILDGHSVLHVSSDLGNNSPFFDDSMSAMDLLIKLRYASFFSTSLMDSISILQLQDQNLPANWTPLIFQTLVSNEPPTTLRNLLVQSGSLDQDYLRLPENALDLAKGLAEAVHGLQICGVDHGQITPDCILLTRGPKNKFQVALHGFDITPSDGIYWTGVDGPYTVPGLYHMDSDNQAMCDSLKNDIRNVGVCLLEIGMSASFLRYQEHDTTPGALWTVTGTTLFPGAPANQSQQEVCSRLISMADALNTGLGPLYIEVIKACLTVGERASIAGIPGKIDLAIWFVEEVLFKLHNIDFN